MTRETSCSRQRTGSSRPARASAVRSRVNRASTPLELSFREVIANHAVTGSRARGARGRKVYPRRRRPRAARLGIPARPTVTPESATPAGRLPKTM